MAPRIRRAELTDAASVTACLLELGYDTPVGLVAEKLAALTGRSTDAIFVAEGDPGCPLSGVISVHVLPLFHAPGNLARITALAVRREAQGRGIGRALVAAAEAFGWASDCRRIEVTSGDLRRGAHAFYRALGYALDERRFLKHAPGLAQAAAPVRPDGAAG